MCFTIQVFFVNTKIAEADTNLKPELTDTWPRRLGEDPYTVAKIDELKKYLSILLTTTTTTTN